MIARFDSGARTATLYRPVGPKELELVAASEWREFPPRLPGQPIFYPVANEAYATQIARNWNVEYDGAGFVLKFAVDAYCLSQYPIQKVGGEVHTEYWIPAEGLAEFNQSVRSRCRASRAFAALRVHLAVGGLALRCRLTHISGPETKMRHTRFTSGKTTRGVT